MGIYFLCVKAPLANHLFILFEILRLCLFLVIAQDTFICLILGCLIRELLCFTHREQDKSWRVRYMVANQLYELCEAVGPEPTRYQFNARMPYSHSCSTDSVTICCEIGLIYAGFIV